MMSCWGADPAGASAAISLLGAGTFSLGAAELAAGACVQAEAENSRAMEVKKLANGFSIVYSFVSDLFVCCDNFLQRDVFVAVAGIRIFLRHDKSDGFLRAGMDTG